MKNQESHSEGSEYRRVQCFNVAMKFFHSPLVWAVLNLVILLIISYFSFQEKFFFEHTLFVTIPAFIVFLGLIWSIGVVDRRKTASSILRIAIDESIDGALITAIDGSIGYSNTSFYRLLGITVEENLDGVKSLDELRALLNKETAVYHAFRRLEATSKVGGEGQEEFFIDVGPALVEWRRLRINPIPSNNSITENTSVIWRIEDITAEREIDIVRRQEETHLADFLDLLPVGFFSANEKGRLQYVNQTLANWLNDTPEKMIGSALDVYMRTEEGNIESNVANVSFKRKNGGDFSGWVVPSFNEKNTVRSSYNRCVVLRCAEWDCRQHSSGGGNDSEDGSSEVRLHWLFDEAPVGIVLLDLQGNISECNIAFLYLIGLKPEDLIGHPFTDRVAKEDRGDAAAALSKVVMGTAKTAHIEIRMPSAGERELVASLYASRLENELGEISGLAMHFIDTTEQRNLEVQFAQSQKMDAIGQLAGGIAHDFNNLLTAMIGFADLLLTRHGPDDPSFSDIQQIRQNANRATNLVRQLLAFSRKQALNLAKLDVTETLNDLTTLLARLIGEKINLILEHGSELGAIKFDRGQFDQIIINLAVNARDAMPGGGQLTIRTSAVVLDQPVQRGHDLMGKGNYILIEVTDTGTGIRKEDLEKIFEPFFSTKEVGAGTGLGLSTVYGILHQTEGFIFVDSAPGEGTCFSIYMPEFIKDKELQHSNEVKTKQSSASETPDSTVNQDGDLTGSGTVLLVEDEDAVRLFGARALRNKGYKVLEAENGERALDVINEIDEGIDLIISDVVMPGMDGHTLIGLVRHELPDVKVILMSGYAEDVFREEIDRDHTIKFLPKPFSLQTLASTVKGVLEG